MADDFKREIPHIIVMAILVFILLFVLTKFKWMQCTQVPGDWCSLYCSVSGNPRIAYIQGEGGIGDSLALSNEIRKNRLYTFAEAIPINGISSGVLKNYELIIVEGAKRMTPLQVNALYEYASSGGGILWIGDSGSERYLSDADIQDALRHNMTSPGYYERVVKAVNDTRGFGPTIESFLKLNYEKSETGKNLTIKIISKDHPFTKGLKTEFQIPATELSIVNPNSPSSSILAYAYGTESCTEKKPCPAIIASRFSGPVAYVAFPLEESGTKSLITNMLDYLVTC
ncbi:MAG: hypothetical protein V1658_01875 [Candidatus Micrarchaeota archaeon]